MSILQGWQTDFASFERNDEEIFCSATHMHITLCHLA